MKKLWISLALAVLCLTRAYAAPPFTDVQAGSYYYDAVLWAVEQGVTGGFTPTSFGPGEGCTRAHAVTFLWRAAGSPEPGKSGSFRDVPAGAYYAKAVEWAAERGITGGTDSTHFSPERACSRAQIVTFLYRAAGTPAVEGKPVFGDVASDAYFRDAVKWALDAGITTGTTYHTFSPYEACTRGQIVTFLYRYDQRTGKPSDVTPPAPEQPEPVPPDSGGAAPVTPNETDPNLPPSVQEPTDPNLPPQTQPPAPVPAASAQTAETFRTALLNVIETVRDGGGYSISRTANKDFATTTWEGMDKAFLMTGEKPEIRLELARPSFCSSAVYMAVMKALLNWDAAGVISRQAWVNLRPYGVDGGLYPYQHDGTGCWGRANANGPGFAVLAAQLGAGGSFYVGHPNEYANSADYWKSWESAQPGDLLKIFWNDAVGADENPSTTDERGHFVIFLGRETANGTNGTRDDIIRYWSSNGSGSMPSGGYGKSQARASQIYRAVLTRVTDPAAFNNAAEIDPEAVDPWLSALDGKHLATVEEMKAAITGADMAAWLG